MAARYSQVRSMKNGTSVRLHTEDAEPSNTVHAAPYAWYALLLLNLAYICSFIDRTILNMMIVPIKADLGLSDTQMSLIIGLAFSLFYVTAGIPIARLADRYSRRSIIIMGILIWSGMTSSGALAFSFFSLFALRVGVAVGESALSPSAMSMIADLFPRDKVSTASGLYSSAVYIGTGLALLLGGVVIESFILRDMVDVPVLGELRPWQFVFLLAGIPGFLVATLMLFTMREPARSRIAQESDEMPTFSEFLRYFYRHKDVYLRIIGGTAMFSLMGFAIASWLPTYFLRVFELSYSEIGTKLGISLMSGGAIGVIFGGLIASILFKKHRDAVCLVGMAAAIGSLVFGVWVTRAASADMAFLLVFPAYVFKTLPIGVSLAAVVLITPSRMRAQTIALFLLLDSLIGLGLGPTAVALFTDYVFQDEALVGNSMAAVIATTMPIAFILYASARRRYRRIIDRQTQLTLLELA